MAANEKDLETALAEIRAGKKQSKKEIDSELVRMNNRLKELGEKISSGEVLTDDENKEQTELVDGINKLADMKTRAVLFDLAILDDSEQVKYQIGQIESANKTITDIKKKIEDLSKSLKDAGDFLNGVAAALTKLAGLLAAFT
jgi:prefoldin subunit 5